MSDHDGTALGQAAACGIEGHPSSPEGKVFVTWTDLTFHEQAAYCVWQLRVKNNANNLDDPTLAASLRYLIDAFPLAIAVMKRGEIPIPRLRSYSLSRVRELIPDLDQSIVPRKYESYEGRKHPLDLSEEEIVACAWAKTRSEIEEADYGKPETERMPNVEKLLLFGARWEEKRRWQRDYLYVPKEGAACLTAGSVVEIQSWLSEMRQDDGGIVPPRLLHRDALVDWYKPLEGAAQHLFINFCDLDEAELTGALFVFEPVRKILFAIKEKDELEKMRAPEWLFAFTINQGLCHIRERLADDAFQRDQPYIDHELVDVIPRSDNWRVLYTAEQLSSWGLTDGSSKPREYVRTSISPVFDLRHWRDVDEHGEILVPVL
ncbi:hypothetical protein MMC25_005021 [Agyrium rufum]|nr:hypothetical protein [Agyrium rufum]